MLPKFKSTLYKIISENVEVNDTLKNVADKIKDKIDNVLIKQNQIFLFGNLEQILNELDKVKQIIKSVIGEEKREEDLLLYYPNIIEFDRNWLHSKTRDEVEIPADINILADNIDVEGKWISLRDGETFAVITKGDVNDIKKNIKMYIGDQKDKVFMLVVSTMVGCKPNTIIGK